MSEETTTTEQTTVEENPLTGKKKVSKTTEVEEK